MLLRFRVANHRSIRDEQTLSFMAVPRRGEPKQLSTVRAAGVYGANASGKSNVLDALRWMISAVQVSHRQWDPAGGIPHRHFKLSATGADTPSFYELDFLHENVRYSYGFEVNGSQVLAEWLNSFPHGRTRKLFDRSGPGEIDFGRGLVGETERIRRLTRPNSLYLSCAASNNHPLLSSLHEHLTSHVLFAQHGEHDEKVRLLLAKTLLADPAIAPTMNQLLRIADLGLEAAEIVEVPLPPRSEEILQHLSTIEDLGPFPPDTLDELRKEIRLRRPGGHALRLREESAGTRVWLSLLGHSLAALGSGGMLVADEIDSNLHPLLSSTLIRMFKDPVVNRTNAQLLFASHDTTLLGSMLDDQILERDEVWFTEKDESGATRLYSLAEFTPRRDENVERGYLQGRYGAVPYLSFDNIRELFTERPLSTP
ncbi:ATP-binding protein [Nonomuraea sp. NPDC046570]|uniref:AAA family ATPase n=1 Tax=Nonomuraea sp. NPDC046570 TaxID=3155255 RepID=UPI0033F83AEE